MQAQRPGKQAVAEGNLDDVLIRHAGSRPNAGDQLRPGVDVLFGIHADRGLAGGPGGGVDAHNIFHWARHHAKGIIVADVILCGKGDILDIRQGLYLIAGNPRFFQPLMIKRDVIVAIIHHLFQLLQL